MQQGNRRRSSAMGNSTGHGMWHNVKNALGGLFGPGLSGERKTEVEVLFGLIGFLAKSDGLITSYESDFTNNLLDHLELNLDGRAIAMAAYDAGRTQGYDVETAARRFQELHKTGSPEFESLFESLLRLALSDDRVYPRERQALVRVSTAFGVTEKSLDQRLAELKH
jgi:DnaJ like chaperone protein